HEAIEPTLPPRAVLSKIEPSDAGDHHVDDPRIVAALERLLRLEIGGELPHVDGGAVLVEVLGETIRDLHERDEPRLQGAIPRREDAQEPVPHAGETRDVGHVPGGRRVRQRAVDEGGLEVVEEPSGPQELVVRALVPEPRRDDARARPRAPVFPAVTSTALSLLLARLHHHPHASPFERGPALARRCRTPSGNVRVTGPINGSAFRHHPSRVPPIASTPGAPVQTRGDRPNLPGP